MLPPYSLEKTRCPFSPRNARCRSGSVLPLPRRFRRHHHGPNRSQPGRTVPAAFVTSTTRDARSTIIDDYNTFVTKVANTVPSYPSWGPPGRRSRPLLRSLRVTIRIRSPRRSPVVALGVPIYRLDNVQIAASNDDLWDRSLLAPINILRAGQQSGPAGVVRDRSRWSLRRLFTRWALPR